MQLQRHAREPPAQHAGASVGEAGAPAAQAGSKGCGDGGAPAREEKRGALRLRAGLNDTALAAALAPFSKRKVLVFDDIRAAFAGFADPADAVKCGPALALPRCCDCDRGSKQTDGC